MSVVTDYLEARGVPYEVIHHDPSSTSLAEARALGVDADVVLKAIVIDTRGGTSSRLSRLPNASTCTSSGKRCTIPTRISQRRTRSRVTFPSIELGGAPVARVAARRPDAGRSLRAGARQRRVRSRNSDGVGTGPDGRSVPRGTCRFHADRVRAGEVGGDERPMRDEQADGIRRIVVGVDGSDGAARAVAWSARLARATGAEVVAVTCDRDADLPGRIPVRRWMDTGRSVARRVEGMARAHT